jgi:hypothetical protein
MFRFGKSLRAALIGGLMTAVLATSASAQVRPPAYGEGPGVSDAGVPVRELPNTGSGPGDADENREIPFLVLAALGAGGTVALGVLARRRRQRGRA